ncbi:probable LRR receptor-like serine/threonine-protein kinase At1g53430 [Jatropha curcas]|uniref:probable LRR receptor-like serine/threonine-protein kinase At1g53430 n=1 Tax=Jatropha curcas TaxID=180498 RepID=UPI001893BE8D|nr:probable LRR receptor-like serine/threonine-protein kinase At1g53430 [Jatropha curcas]
MQSFTVKQIIDATQKFSPKTKIGDGRLGIIYKAQLQKDLIVAVKKLFPQSKTVEEIRAEIMALSELENPNLVELLDCYSKRGLHLLIYEYMDNGSLEKVLFALGLEFLHKKNPPIIHRNIKASNILLHENYEAKISDFGLAKLYEDDDPFMLAKAGITRKYMAPEYASQGKITVKADVYSFGILPLEIVSGIRIDKNLGNDEDTIYLLEKGQKTVEDIRTLLETRASQVSRNRDMDPETGYGVLSQSNLIFW